MNFKESRKVLFVHDGPLVQDEDGQFYGTGLNDEIRKRYLRMGTEVSFLIRVVHKKKAACQDLNPISNEYLKVIAVQNFKSFLGYFTLRPKAKRIVEQAVREHDVIFARLPSGIGSLAVQIAYQQKKPLLAELVACTKDTYWYHSIKGKMIAYYFYHKQRAVMKKVGYCIYVTDKFLQQRYPIQGKSIACSDVYIENTEDAILSSRIHKIKTRQDCNPVLLGSVGKLSMRLKGYRDVIRAIAMLKSRGIIFHYALVGSGNTDYLQKLIKELDLEQEVRIMGPSSRQGVFHFMDKIDLYIQPSRTEGLPRAMVEAMSRACPVMGSDAGGIPELVGNNMFFESGNVKRIAHCLALIDRDKLIEEATRSFHKAKEYENKKLEQKRMSFYSMFLEDNKLKGYG